MESGDSRLTVGGHLPDTVAEYLPQNSLPSYQSGDVLGVYQPANADSRVSLRYEFVPDDYGYNNQYYRTSVMSLEEFDTAGSSKENNYPLIAVTTSENPTQTFSKSQQRMSYLLCVAHKILCFSCILYIYDMLYNVIFFSF